MADKKDKTLALGSEPIPRLVLRFSATTLIALLLNSVYALTDALFVSWGVGDNAMGGVSLVFPFVLLQGAIASAVGSGAASIVSRRLGEGNPAAAGEATRSAMAAFYSTAVITSLLGLLLLEPLLRGMGVTQELYAPARQYFIIILAGNVFSTGFSSIIRAEGKMLYGMLIWVIPISINIALDALFILGLGWGVAGAALATVICQAVSCGMSVLFFLKFSTQQFRGTKVRLRRIGEILAIGLPSLVQMGSLSAMSVLLNNVLGSVAGTLGVTVFAYISKIISFGIVPFTAAAQALAPIVGYNHGSGRKDRAQKAVTFCIAISASYAAAALLCAQLLPRQLMGIFTNNAEIIALGAAGIRVISLALLFMPLPMLGGAAFQAAGNKTWALLLYAASTALMIPLALLFGKSWGISGVWWAYTAANFGATLLAGGRLLRAGDTNLR